MVTAGVVVIVIVATAIASSVSLCIRHLGICLRLYRFPKRAFLGGMVYFFQCSLVPEDWFLEQLLSVRQYNRVVSQRPVTGADMLVLIY